MVLAANPSAMTLEGTNTWLLHGADELGQAIVVDPGPDDDAHLDAVIEAAGRVVRILLTHGHPDHSDGARRLHERTGAAVSALDPRWQFGGEGLHDGDVVSAAGLEVRVWSTPGHTADSLSFVLDGADGSSGVLTGDTVLGRGSTLIAEPDGDLGDYLASLRRLSELGPIRVLPGHGPDLEDAHAAAEVYLAHRRATAGPGPDGTGRPGPRSGAGQRAGRRGHRLRRRRPGTLARGRAIRPRPARLPRRPTPSALAPDPPEWVTR